MAYETIKYEVEDQILIITLNRPDKLNAFNAAMQKEMIDAFDSADRDDNVRAIIVTGAGRDFAPAPIFPPAPTPSTDARRDRSNASLTAKSITATRTRVTRRTGDAAHFQMLKPVIAR